MITDYIYLSNDRVLNKLQEIESLNHKLRYDINLDDTTFDGLNDSLTH